jgi:hypothetical protein
MRLFDPELVHVRSAVDKMAMGLRYFRVSPPLLHTHLHVNITYIRAYGRSLGTFKLHSASSDTKQHTLFLLVFKAMSWLETVSRWSIIADVFKTEVLLSADSVNK